MKNITYERLKDFERDPSNNFLTRSEMMEAVKELIATRELRGEQMPVFMDALRDAVAEMSGGLPLEWREGTDKGHHAVPFINFNSLHRIVTKFTAPQKPVVPEGLHPQTAKLVIEFATALAEKLHKAEQKYGYSDMWMHPGWQDKCLSDFNRHISKGDPRDVAAYCAFMWYHGWPTTIEAAGGLPTPQATIEAAPQKPVISKEKLCDWLEDNFDIDDSKRDAFAECFAHNCECIVKQEGE